MKINFKLTNGKVVSPGKFNDLDSVLQLVRSTKLGMDDAKEFNLHVKETGETFQMNHKDIKAIEIEFK